MEHRPRTSRAITAHVSETPGEAELLRCPTAYVGEKYEIEIESEEGSGCSPIYDYFEIVNSTLPAGLTMSRDGVISGVPTSAGFTRFWIRNHDLTEANGGPDWCERDDVSEREFSIYVDPGLAIDNESVKAANDRPALFGDAHREAGRDPEPAHWQRACRRRGPCSRERFRQASRSRQQAS